MKKNIRLILAVVMTALIVGSVTLSCMYSTGIFMSGNRSQYNPSQTEKTDSALIDQSIVFVGSNLVTGSKASGDSFVEYLRQSHGINAVVYGKDGASLVERGANSIPAMIRTIPTENANPRMILCEVPYIDGTGYSRIGQITDGYFNDQYDTKSVIGAMEFIISYSQDTWGCPVVFYTCQPNDNTHYAKIVDAVLKVADKWNIEVIDFYHDEGMVLDDRQQALYMATDSCPTKAGYKELYTPRFEEFLLKKIY